MTVDRLGPADEVMLAASSVWPQDVAALLTLEAEPLLDDVGRFRIDVARDSIGRRLHHVPRLRQLIRRPARGLGGAFWTDAAAFDVADHVRVRRLEPPGDDTALFELVEELRRERVDPDRPPWAMWFLTGRADGRIGLFVKLHHAMADGLAALSMLRAVLADVAEAPVAEAPLAGTAPWVPSAPPTAGALALDRLRRVLDRLAGAMRLVRHPRATGRRVTAAIPGVRELFAERPGPPTSLDRRVGTDRRLALLRVATADVRRAARLHDATVNDVLLSATAGGLRALLAGRGEPVADVSLPVYVPVTLRRRLRGPQAGNEIAQMVVPLPIGEPNPARRLRRIATETARRKLLPRASLGTLFRAGPLRRLLLRAVSRQRVSVTTACLPGPRRPLCLAGARVLEIFPVLRLIGNESVAVGAVSYAGTFCIGVIADRAACPDFDVLAAAIASDLREPAQAHRGRSAEAARFRPVRSGGVPASPRPARTPPARRSGSGTSS